MTHRCCECGSDNCCCPATPKYYYFGCLGGPGHYIWQQSGLPHSRSSTCGPWHIHELDTRLAPNLKDKPEGVAKLRHKDGWTALAFWDRSVDPRSNSNSVFITDRLLNFEEAMAVFRKAFPQVVGRFKFNIVEHK